MTKPRLDLVLIASNGREFNVGDVYQYDLKDDESPYDVAFYTGAFEEYVSAAAERGELEMRLVLRKVGAGTVFCKRCCSTGWTLTNGLCTPCVVREVNEANRQAPPSPSPTPEDAG